MFRGGSALLLAASILFPIPSSAVTANPSAVCSASCVLTFPYSNDYYQWTVPVSATYTLEVWGAQGGNAGYNGTVATNGGKGGYAKGFISLTAGQTVYIYVGGQGEGTSGTSTANSLAGGFNGGGNGYNGNSNTERGGGGGGGTDVRVGGNTFTDRVIIAGGGAGAVTTGGTYGTNYPGVGGGVVGGNGYTSVYAVTSNLHGKGGNQAAGGAGGTNGNTGAAGALGIGGGTTYHSAGYGIGGGGGGYYGGGGGGTGMGAGGGSGYTGGVTSTTLSDGATSMPNPSGGTMTGNSGNGVARITYTITYASISLTVAGNAQAVVKGQSIVLTATIDAPGKVTFYADGKKIPRCISLTASIGTITCTWKPAVQKPVKLSAYIAPSNGAIAAYSAGVNASTAKRTTTR